MERRSIATWKRSVTLILFLVGVVAALTVPPAVAGQTDTAAGPWQKQEPIPTPWHFHDVDMVSIADGWAVAAPTTGDHATIWHTRNGGATWQRQGPLARQLLAVSFFDAQHGVAAGNEIRYTTDGGQTWQLGSSSGGSVYDADLVTSQVGYASGLGSVKKTADGGKTWTIKSVPLQGNLSGIDFVDANTGWVVGDQGSVFKTIDGGDHWTQQRHDTGRFYTGVSFVDALTGWVSANNHVLHTTDGGQTWIEQAVPAGADAIEVRFLDAQNGFAAGALRTLMRTTDGGQTWNLQLGGVFEEPNNRYPFNGLDGVDPTHAVAVGNANTVYTTTDGQTWMDRTNGSSTIPFRFARTDSQHLWAANSNSEVLYTVDGGKRWKRSIIQVSLGCDICSNTGDIAFLNNLEGWAVINGEFTSTSWIWHSTDGGVTWQSLNVTSTGPLSGLAIVDSQTLVAVSGIDDLIFRSTNGGQTWKPVAHPRGGSWFGSVRFVPGTQTGWTVGEGGKILRSTDGGATWTRQRDASHLFNLIDVSFSDVSNGWTVGGEELHTTDGGQTWVRVSTGVRASVSVYTLSPTVAWIGGLQDLGRTTDGGATWAIERPSNTDWYALTFVDQNIGWAAGQDQLIDDVPGSIWKRGSTVIRAQPPMDGPDPGPGVLKAPPSAGN